MEWWQALITGTGGVGLTGLLARLWKNRRLRAIAAEVLDPSDSRQMGVLEELRTILDEQRKGYDHLSTRVSRLEDEVANLERLLASAKQRERKLEQQLKEERKQASTRIADLERELAAAQARISVLETQLAAARSKEN